MRVSDTNYTLVLMDEGGSTYDVSDFATDLGWEENESELSLRLSCTLGTDNAQLRSLVKLGCMMFVLSNGVEVARGFIQDVESQLSNPTDQIKVSCYDELIALEKSEEQYYFAAGQSTSAVLTQIFSEAGIPIGEYTGADVVHDKLAYKSGSMADTVLDILKDAKKRGGAETLIRAKQGAIDVIAYGSNDEIYQFDQDDTIMVKYGQSITNLVTRVKIIGKATSETTRPPVEAIQDGMTQFGIRQKIVTKSKSQDAGAAETEAAKIMEENGKPEETTTVQSPDVPSMRKGDKVYLLFGNVSGFFFVRGIKHDAMDGTMTLTLKPAS